MAQKYPPDVMQPYNDMWGSFTVCGVSLASMIVALGVAQIAGALRSEALPLVGVGLFIVAAIAYARGFRQLRLFQTRVKAYKATGEGGYDG